MKELNQQEKLGIYAKIKANPALGLFQAFEVLRKEILDSIEAKVGAISSEVEGKALLKGIEQIKGEPGNPGDPGKPGRTPQKGVDYFTEKEINIVIDEILKMAKNKEIDEMAKEISKKSKPIKGIDYFTDQEVEDIIRNIEKRIKIPEPKIPKVSDGKTPLKGIDYPTHKQVSDVIKSEIDKISFKKEKPVDTKLMAQKIMMEITSAKNADEIARSLETLTGTKKLDYYSLKNLPNLPGIPMYDTKRGTKRLGRGTGSPVKVYDLSDQLNGVLKTFTIPNNLRVLVVHLSSTPNSSARPTVDYTTTSTTITFTDQIDAATTLAAGQSLLVEYVEA